VADFSQACIGIRFHVHEDENHLAMEVKSADGKADVSFSARVLPEWHGTVSFETLDEISEFFRKGDCGFSCSLRGKEFEGLQMKTLHWAMVPMEVEAQHCAFYSDTSRFPRGSIEYACSVPHFAPSYNIIVFDTTGQKAPRPLSAARGVRADDLEELSLIAEGKF